MKTEIMTDDDDDDDKVRQFDYMIQPSATK